MGRETETLQQMIDESSRIVFFGGAGVSTESGIPDFRSVDGLYNQKYDYPPETILSHTFYVRRPEEFFRFYRDKMLCLDAKPNTAHQALAKLEVLGKLSAVVTQNIDGLHQAAGSRKVLELHGSVLRNYCEKCHSFHAVEEIVNSTGVPVCACGGRIKPDVVLYEEGLDQNTLQEAVRVISDADHRRHFSRGVPGGGADRLLPGEQARADQQDADAAGHQGGSGHHREYRRGVLADRSARIGRR